MPSARTPRTVGEPDDSPESTIVHEPDAEAAAALVLSSEPIHICGPDCGPDAHVPAVSAAKAAELEDLQVALPARGSGYVEALAPAEGRLRGEMPGTALQFNGTNLPELEAAFGIDVIRLNEIGVQAKVLVGVDDAVGWLTIPEHAWVCRRDDRTWPFLLTPDAAHQLGIAP